MADWIPGAVVGLGSGVAGTFARMWRTEAVFQTRLEALERKLCDFIAQYREERQDLISELKTAAEGMRKAALEIAVLVERQTIINRMNTDALKGILDRQEAQTQALAELHGRIASGK